MNGMDRDISEYLVQSGGLNAEEDALQQQMAMAQALRKRSGTPDGRQVGNTYVAANPLEHLASGLGQFQAGRQERGYQPKMDDITRRRRESIEGVMNRVGGPRSPAATPGFMGPLEF